MKNFQKIIVASAMFAFLLAAPITILAATPRATVEPTAVESSAPVLIATAPPAEVTPIAATPAPQSTFQWIITHKKISLGVLLLVAAGGFMIFQLTKKGNQNPPDKETKTEEEPKEEDQKPPEETV